MKKHFFTLMLAVLFFAVSVHSQSIPRKVQKGQEAWRFMKRAADFYVSNDFGNALEAAENAKSIRMQDAAWRTYILENTLKKARVRKAGDLLENVIPELKALDLNEAVDVINFFLELKGDDFFDNSFARIIDYIPVYAQYPEADYLLGKVYRIEGEFDIALQYMENAYKFADNLDVPMEKYDLLYDLADLSKDLGKNEDFEKYLLLVIKDDAYYKDPAMMKSLFRIIGDTRQDAVEKFFILYRYENIVALKAFVNLGNYYASVGEYEKSLKCAAIASIISITKINNVLEDRITDFEYVTVKGTLEVCKKYDDILDWGNKNQIWELFHNFAVDALNCGNVIFARKLLTILSTSNPEPYWQKAAGKKLITNE